MTTEIFLLLILTLTKLSCLHCTLYTVRRDQRLTLTPLTSVTFKQPGTQDNLGRCLMTCKMTSGCCSVNAYWDDATLMMTCEFLGVYLHEVTGGLTPAPGWIFVQEDPVYTEPTMALAFRATSAIDQSVWDTWQQDGRHDDPLEMPGCTRLSASSQPCGTHFRSYILDHWTNIDQVQITLHKDDRVAAKMTFNGQTSTRTSWIDLSRLMTSTWMDMTSSASTNYFSVEGLPHVYRRFYLSRYHSGCPSDVGWMVVADTHPEATVNGQCSWEKNIPLPAILFSSSSSASTWDLSDAADFMLVHVTFQG